MFIHEGGVDIEVPETSRDGRGDHVFFNPVQELNRDITVATLRAYRTREPRADTYFDATAASGIRGVRAAADEWTVTCADVDPDAVALCRSNLNRNDLDGNIEHTDANVLFHQTYFDVADIDPFGTPIPFVDAAVRGTRNLLCVTATDTAPLCGAHFEAGVRRYGAIPRNTEYHGEMGVRILLSALIRTAARHDVAATPLLTHATKHYVRTYLELDRGAGVANDALETLGHIYHCEHCLWRTSEAGLHADAPDACPQCGHGIQTAGPVRLGGTCEPEFVDLVRDRLSPTFGTFEQAQDLLSTLASELPVPTHYDQHRLCKRWGRPAGPMDEFLDQLSEAGYESSLTHYGGTTFKTDAAVDEIAAATVD